MKVIEVQKRVYECNEFINILDQCVRDHGVAEISEKNASELEEFLEWVHSFMVHSIEHAELFPNTYNGL